MKTMKPMKTMKMLNLSDRINLVSFFVIAFLSIYLFLIPMFSMFPMFYLGGRERERERERERKSPQEQFLPFSGLTKDPRPDYARKKNIETTFPTFEFHAEPNGYIQIGHFMLNWGESQWHGRFKKQFDVPIGAIAIDHNRGSGQDNIKLKSISRGEMRLHQRHMEVPIRFIAWGVKNVEKKRSSISVDDVSNKSEGIKRVMG